MHKDIDPSGWYLEADLRYFIHHAERYPLEVSYKILCDPNNPGFRERYDNISINYDKFREQLAQKAAESMHPQAVGIAVKRAFMPMMDKFIQWYNEHKEETAVYNPNFYKLVFEIVVKTKEEIEAYFPEPGEPKTEQEQPTFTNNFDHISPVEVYEHFKKGLVEKKYLAEQELNEYLKAAFEKKTIPGTRFKIKNAPTKAAIEAVFYRYYRDVAGKIHGKKEQYAALLGEYFEGYKTTTVSSNFSKSVY